MKKILLILPLFLLTLLFSPVAARADDHHHRGRHYDNGSRHGKRNLNDGYDRYYNSRGRGFDRRNYQGRSRYYRDGRYYYRGRDGYYPYGSRPDRGGVSISF